MDGGSKDEQAEAQGGRTSLGAGEARSSLDAGPEATEVVWSSSAALGRDGEREDGLGPSAGQQRRIPQAECIKTLQYTIDRMGHRRLTDSQTCLTGWRSGVRRDREYLVGYRKSKKTKLA